MSNDIEQQTKGIEELDNPRVSPEALVIADTYLHCLDIDATAKELEIPREEVVWYLNKAPVRRYVDTVFLEQGYLNRHKIQDALSTVISKKLEDLEMTELVSNKDIADLLKMAHDMRMKELELAIKREAKAPKEHKEGTQINVQQNNYGANYMDLLNKIVGGPNGNQ